MNKERYEKFFGFLAFFGCPIFFITGLFLSEISVLFFSIILFFVSIIINSELENNRKFVYTLTHGQFLGVKTTPYFDPDTGKTVCFCWLLFNVDGQKFFWDVHKFTENQLKNYGVI